MSCYQSQPGSRRINFKPMYFWKRRSSSDPAMLLRIRFPPARPPLLSLIKTPNSWNHMEGGICFFLLLLFFFFSSFFFSTLKEGSILVFPKREQQQQQGNEGASKFGPVPGTAQFSRLPYKNPGGKSVEAVGSFLLGSGGL